jgi:hypothetical protein
MSGNLKGTSPFGKALPLIDNPDIQVPLLQFALHVVPGYPISILPVLQQ